jgi:PAS domain S-box-containing protein
MPKQLAFHESSDALLVFEVHTLRVLEANRAAERLTGRPAAELASRNLRDFLEPAEGWPEGQTTPFPSRRWTLSRADGLGPLPVRVKLRTGPQDGATGLAVIRPDDVLLAGGDAAWNAVVAHVSDIVMTIDRDGAILDINRVYPELTRDEVIGATVYDFIEPDEIEPYRERVERAFATGKGASFEVRGYGLGGTLAWYATRMAPINRRNEVAALLLICTDITERKLADEALRKERDLLRAILATSVAAVTVLDRCGRFVYANRRAEEVFGLTHEGVLQRSYNSPEWKITAHDGSPMPPDQLPFARVMATNDRLFNEPLAIERPDGRRRLLIVSGAPLHDPAGKPDGAVFHIEDATDRLRLMEERQLLEKKLHEAQHLESLRVLAGGIAHDFNNLLTGVLGNASLARSEVAPGSTVRQSLEEIESAATRAADLCKQMLAYSGRGRFIIEKIDASGLVRSSADILRVAAGRAGLTFGLARDLPATPGDAGQIRQALTNLVLNAAEAIGDREGVITVRTGVRRVDAKPSANGDSANGPDVPAGDYVFLEVADTGCGMEAETRRRVFEPFFTTKFPGRGLGLSAVLGIARGHKGGVRIESTPGQGTTATLLLPKEGSRPVAPAADPAPRPAALEEGPAPTWRGQGCVLVADDEAAVRQAAARILESVGFRAVQACDGREAVTQFEAHSDVIELALLDLTMPHVDGEEAFRELRRLRPALPVIIMSGYSEQEATARFQGQGVLGFVQKPFRPVDLLSLLRRL